MNKNTFKVGDEVFYVSGHIQRGTVETAHDYGYKVKTENGSKFFADVSTYTKQQAYDECVELVEYFKDKANALLSEIEQAEELDDDEQMGPYQEAYDNYVAH